MDNFFSNIFRKRGAAPPPPKGVPGVPSSTLEQQQPTVGGGSFRERVVYTRAPEQALMISAVYRAVNLRGDTMSVMPVQYQKKDYTGGNYTLDMRGLGKRINYLLQEEPNPVMSATDMWRLVEINRLFYGNSFVYMERDEFGFPLHLWLVKSGSYNTVEGNYTNIVYLGDHGYKVLTNVARENVLHFANTFRHQDGVWGMPTLQYAIETLSLNRTLRAQSLDTAAKGGRVKVLIGEEKPSTGGGTLAFGLMNKNQMDTYAQELQKKMYSGHDILAIRGLDKVHNISMTSVEMQMFEQLGATYDDISRFFGVPRPLLMLDTNSHYNDYQNATMEFHTRTILPQKAANEKEIARKLIGFKDYGVRRIHICEDPLLAMDPERRAKVDQLNLQTGAKTVNEIRAGHDMPAVEKGDIVYVSTNLAELGSEKLSGGAGSTLEPGTYTVPEQEPPAGEEENQID